MNGNALHIKALSSPHIKGELRTDVIMRNVAIALLPVAGVSVLAFGVSVLLLIMVAVAACVATEYVFCRLSGKPDTVGDFSAVVTGMLLALTLPPAFPLWMAAVGGFVAIALGKALFGGLGYNVFNPALVGRAFLAAAFPATITTWTPPGIPGRFWECIPSTLAAPFMSPPPVDEYIARAADGFSGATPLASIGDPSAQLPGLLKLATGAVAGSAGETSAVIILACGAYLAARKMLDWRIPAGIFAAVFVFSGIFYMTDPGAYPTPFFMLFSGGLVLGAVFMATDMVTSPVAPAGIWGYSVFIGFMTVLIRLKGGLPEGVMYAILLGNALIPLLNPITQPRIYGGKRWPARK